MLHSQRLLSFLSVSSALLSVRQDDGGRGCFVDTERTWFLECSRLAVWISGSSAWGWGWGGCSWAAGTTLCLWTSLNPLNSSSRAGNWNIVQYWARWWSSITGACEGDGGKRRPSVDQRWAAGPGFKGKAERPGRGKGIVLLAGVGFHHPSCRSPHCVYCSSEKSNRSPPGCRSRNMHLHYAKFSWMCCQRTSCSNEQLEAQTQQRKN